MKMSKAIVTAAVVLVAGALCPADLLQSDDFSDGVWGAQWSKYTNDWSKVDESPGYAWFAKYYGDPWAERGMYSLGDYDIHTEADFSIGIDYDLTWDCPWHDAWRLTWDTMHLELFANGKSARIERRVNNGGDAYFVFLYDDVWQQHADLAFAAESMEGMKFERVGDTLSAYGKTTGEWSFLGSVDVSADMAAFDDGAYVRSRIVVNADRDGKMRIHNFDISQIPEPMTLLTLIGGAAMLTARRPGIQ